MNKFFQKIFENIEKLNSKVVSYEKIAKEVILPSKAYMNWGVFLATSGDIEHALEKFETSANMTLKSPETFLNWGIALARNAQYEQAIEKFINAVKLAPNMAKAHSLLSATYIEIGDEEQAEKAYKCAVELEPKNAEIHINWGISQAKLSKRAQAEKCFEKAIECSPLNVQAMFLWGIVLAEQYKFDEAIEKFEKVVELNPKNSEAYYYIALGYLKKKEYYKAVANAKKSINLFPHKIDSYIILAEACVEQNNFEEAENCYLTAEKLNPRHPVLYISWGASLQKVERFEESLAVLEKVPQNLQDSSSVLFFKAIALSAMGQLQIAIDILKNLVKLEPDDYHMIESLGENYQKNNELKRAISCYNIVLKNARQHNYLYCKLAECYAKMGQSDFAINNYEKFLSYFPENVSAYIRLAYLYIEVDNKKEALRRIRKAYQLRKDGDNGIVIEYIKILILLEDYENAQEKAEGLIEQNPDYELAYFAKAEIFLHSKNYERAKEVLLYIKDNFEKTPQIMKFLGFAFIDIADFFKEPEYYNVSKEYLNNLLNPDDITKDNLLLEVNLAYIDACLGNEKLFVQKFKDIFSKYNDKITLVEKYFGIAIEKLDFGQEFDNLVKEEIEKVKIK